MKNSLIIFIKNAEQGTVKTRLARDLGEVQALEVYRRLMDIAAQAAKSIPVERIAAFSRYIPPKSTRWPETFFERTLQQGENIGARMSQSLCKALENGAEKAVLIGSDCPGYSPELLSQAFEGLNRADVVIGPALDGGYYLIGMKRPLPDIFEGIAWSSSAVYAQTIALIEAKGLSYFNLPTQRDVDTVEDLKHFPSLLEGLE